MKKINSRLRDKKFIGRKKELSILKKFFKHVLNKKGISLTISGENGLGKTALIKEFLQQLQGKFKGGEIAILKGTADKNLPFIELQTIKQISSQLFGIKEKDSKALKSKIIDKFIKSLRNKKLTTLSFHIKHFFSGKITKREALLIKNIKQSERIRILGKILINILTRFSKRNILVMVLDNFHLSDSATIKFIQSLTKEITNSKIMLILTLNPGFDLNGFVINRKIDLSSLTRKEVNLMLEQILECKNYDISIGNIIFKESEGNPLFIEEFINHLLNNKMLSCEGGKTSLKKKEIKNIPSKLNEIILSRYQTLSDNEKVILRVASVSGRSFSIKFLKKFFKQNIPVEKILRRLAELDLICKSKSPLHGQDEIMQNTYFFKHIAVRDVIYSTISTKERKSLNNFYGNTLEHFYSKNTRKILDLLVHYFRLGKDKEKLLKYLWNLFKREYGVGNIINAERILLEWTRVKGKNLYSTFEGVEKLIALADTRGLLAQYNKGLKTLNILEKKSSEIIESKLLPEFLVTKGKLHYSKGQYDDALRYLLDARSIFQVFSQVDIKVLSDCYNGLGLVSLVKGNYNDALKHYLKAVKLRKKIFGDNHPETAKIYINLGIIHKSKGNYKESIKFSLKSLRILKKTYGTENPYIASLYVNIGTVYHILSDFQKAEDFYKKSLKIYLKTLGREHIYTATVINNLGLIYFERDKYSKALKQLNQSLDIRLKLLGHEHALTASSYSTIASVHFKKGNIKKAITFLQKALKIKLKVVGAHHPDVARIYEDIAEICISKREINNALKYYFAAIEIMKKAFGNEHLEIATLCFKIGRALLMKKDFKNALKNFQETIEIRKKVLKKNDPQIYETLFYIAKSQFQINDLKNAKANLKKATRFAEKHKLPWLKESKKLLSVIAKE